MISFENERLAEEAVQLWQEAFHDDEEYIRFFLSRHDDAAVLTECQNGALVSALYLLNGAVIADHKDYKAYYLFAAATFMRRRGQGHMARLLQKAKEYARQNGGHYIALVPASPSLFDYYARFGYQTVFYAKSVPVDSGISFDLTADRFQWSDAHVRYMREEAEAFGFSLAEKSGMLFSVDSETIKIPEPEKEHPHGMLLPLNETAEANMPDHAYIGLTME